MGQNKDITDLYLVSDMLITDYSSVMFDYSILNRPMFFFMYDLESYRDELRGFYFDILKELPGPVSKTTEKLIDDIMDMIIICMKKNTEIFEINIINMMMVKHQKE